MRILDVFDIKFRASHIELKIHNNDIKIIEIASRAGGLRDFLIKNSLGVDYNELLLDSILKKDIYCHISSSPNEIINYCISKFIYTKEDYEFYLKIKNAKDNILIGDFVNISDDKDFSYSSSLLDSKGYYYIMVPKYKDPSEFITKC